MKVKSAEEIKNAIIPIAQDMQIEIFDVEWKINKNPSLTIFIDTEDGVDLNTCEAFHRKIDSVLDELDVSNGACYTLNVSSPGLDRPFKTDRDFERHLGLDVEVKLYAPIKGQKFFEGVLVGYDGKNVEIELTKDNTIKLSLTQIAKINEAIKFDD